MLELAQVGPQDFVLDLGSGDGRIVILAARRFGARGLGVEIVPELVERSRRNAAKAGVADRAQFVEQDLFKTDLSVATVITMYLLQEVNLQLRPALLALKPGTRIVSHDWDMGDWRPDRSITVDAPDKPVGLDKRSRLHLWVVPAQVEGRWCGTGAAARRAAAAGAALPGLRRHAVAWAARSQLLAGRIDGARLRSRERLRRRGRRRAAAHHASRRRAGGASGRRVRALRRIARRARVAGRVPACVRWHAGSARRAAARGGRPRQTARPRSAGRCRWYSSAMSRTSCASCAGVLARGGARAPQPPSARHSATKTAAARREPRGLAGPTRGATCRRMVLMTGSFQRGAACGTFGGSAAFGRGRTQLARQHRVAQRDGDRPALRVPMAARRCPMRCRACHAAMANAGTRHWNGACVRCAQRRVRKVPDGSHVASSLRLVGVAPANRPMEQISG